ncbi:MAG: YqeG family HAD IIIA-type phosphatase [Bacillota bacterium]|nr:YqeG family HAD IIIA-type phosphatase [Bacillota bacterium]
MARRTTTGGQNAEHGWGAVTAGLVDLCTPHVRLGSVLELDPGWLLARDIEALVADLDNTLVPYGQREVDPGMADHVRSMLAAGLRVVILSNAGVARSAPIAAALGVPFIARAGKPALHAYERALAKAGSAPGRAAGVGDQLFRDVLGARRSGLLSVLVAPLSPRDFPGTTLLRGPERLLAAYLRRLGRWPEEGLPGV